MDKVMIAQGVANKLFATENSVDKALAETSQFMNELLQARQEIRAAAVTGTTTVNKVAEAIAALAVARQALVDAHNDLADVKLRVGVRTKLIGIVPKEAVITHEQTRLREVG